MLLSIISCCCQSFRVAVNHFVLLSIISCCCQSFRVAVNHFVLLLVIVGLMWFFVVHSTDISFRLAIARSPGSFKVQYVMIVLSIVLQYVFPFPIWLWLFFYVLLFFISTYRTLLRASVCALLEVPIKNTSRLIDWFIDLLTFLSPCSNLFYGHLFCRVLSCGKIHFAYKQCIDAK